MVGYVRNRASLRCVQGLRGTVCVCVCSRQIKIRVRERDHKTHTHTHTHTHTQVLLENFSAANADDIASYEYTGKHVLQLRTSETALVQGSGFRV